MKVFLILLGILVLLCVGLCAAVGVLTRPRREGKDPFVPIGGMLVSDRFDYAAQRDRRLMRDPLVRLLQLLWLRTKKSDDANHAKQTPPAGVTEHCDLAYLPDGSRYHRLDVYHPADAAGALPVIIDVHGGGWMYGDKELNKLYCLALAARGYTVFNISYPLVPDVTADQQLRDLTRALQWVDAHLEDYPADRNDILLTGDSAGGMLASYLGVLAESAPLRSIFGAQAHGLRFGGVLLTSPVAYMRCKGAMGLYTAKMWGADFKKKPTCAYMNLDAILAFGTLPRTCLITSAGDVLAHEQTLRAAADLRAHGTECKLMDFGGDAGKQLPHVFTVLNPYNDIGRTTLDEALAWFRAAPQAAEEAAAHAPGQTE